MLVVPRIAHKFSFEECDVEDGGIKVDELEYKNFKGEVIIKLGLSSVHF